jgi:nitric oxide reductase activation protein
LTEGDFPLNIPESVYPKSIRRSIRKTEVKPKKSHSVNKSDRYILYVFDETYVNEKIINDYQTIVKNNTLLIKKVTTALEKLVTFSYTRERYLKNGRFKDAVRAYSGNAFYKSRDTAKSKHICASLLIDASGSMSGNKIAAARQTAIIFVESLKSFKTYVFSHDATNYTADVELYLNKYDIMSVRARGGNRDGSAIKCVYDYMCIHNPNDQKVIFVISDGLPTDYDYEEDAVLSTKEVVDTIDAKVFQLGIECDEKDSATMYGKNNVIIVPLTGIEDNFVRFLTKTIEGL